MLVVDNVLQVWFIAEATIVRSSSFISISVQRPKYRKTADSLGGHGLSLVALFMVQ